MSIVTKLVSYDLADEIWYRPIGYPKLGLVHKRTQNVMITCSSWHYNYLGYWHQAARSCWLHGSAADWPACRNIYRPIAENMWLTDCSVWVTTDWGKLLIRCSKQLSDVSWRIAALCALCVLHIPNEQLNYGVWKRVTGSQFWRG